MKKTRGGSPYYCKVTAQVVTDNTCSVRHTFDFCRGFGLCRYCLRGAQLCPGLYPEGAEEFLSNAPSSRTPALSLSGKKKWCGMCQEMKPLADFFVGDRGKVSPFCKSCQESKPPGRKGSPPSQKFCLRCMQVKDGKNFRPRSDVCRECEEKS